MNPKIAEVVDDIGNLLIVPSKTNGKLGNDSPDQKMKKLIEADRSGSDSGPQFRFGRKVSRRGAKAQRGKPIRLERFLGVSATLRETSGF